MLHAMTSDERSTRADANLEAAMQARALADPRPWLRARLRLLRERDPEAFERALVHYQEELLPGVAGGDDPVAAWIAYGRAVGEWTGTGRTVAVDPSGRAAAWSAPHRDDLLVLHLPDAGDAPALAIMSPARPTPAQRAALDLLVLGREGLTG
jgi:hypothetical protein